MNGKVLPVLPDIRLTLNKVLLNLLKFSIEEVETLEVLNQIAQARIVLSGRETDVYSLLKSGQPGNPAEILFITGEAEFIVFSGEVVEQELCISKGISRLTLHLRHTLHRLRQTLRSQVFRNKSDLDIIKKILSDHQITLSSPHGLTLEYPQMVQYQCSDWQFLQYRLHANSVWLVTREDKVTLIDAKLPAGSVGASHVIERTENVDKPGIVGTKWQQRAPRFNNDVKASHWDIDQQKMTPGRRAKKFNLGSVGLDAGDLKASKTSVAELNYGLALEEGEAEACINSFELERQLSAIQARFVLWGGQHYQTGESLQVKGFDKVLDGQGVISEVCHRVTPDKWETELVVGQEAPEYTKFVRALTPAVRGVHIGIVAAHQSDDKKWFRLQIKIPSFNSKDETLWARIALPYASDDGSVGFYPNPGDEVIVAFLEDDPRYPVVLGSVHNPKKKPPKEFDEKNINDKKYIVLGNDDKHPRLIFNVKENTIEMSSMKMEATADKFEVMVDEMDVAATKKFVTKADKYTVQAEQVLIEGKKIELKK